MASLLVDPIKIKAQIRRPIYSGSHLFTIVLSGTFTNPGRPDSPCNYRVIKDISRASHKSPPFGSFPVLDR